MMLPIQKWLTEYQKAVIKQFGARVQFIGLQGSYGRGEAAKDSDIDVVLILDSVSYTDLSVYSHLLDTLPERGKICGFLAGESELKAWDKSDLFQFCNDTTPILGSLKEITAAIQEEDVRRAVKMGACNLYHGCVHNAVHAKDSGVLKGLYKSAAFTLQAIAYLRNGVFVRKQAELSEHLAPEDRKVLETRLLLQKVETISPAAFEELSEQLMKWASSWILRMDTEKK